MRVTDGTPVGRSSTARRALRRLRGALPRRWPLGLRLLAAVAPVLVGCWPGDAAQAPRAPCRSRPLGEPMTQIRWIDAARPSDAAALARWCATVGPPVLLTAPAAAEPTDSLVIVSWNVHVGGGDIAGLVADLRAGRLTDGRPVRSFVLLLQEAYRSAPEVPAHVPLDVVPHRIAPLPPSGHREDVVQSARRTGLSLLYVPSMRNGIDVKAAARAMGVDMGAAGAAGPGEDRGNAILSTFPLAQPEAIVLPLEAERRVAVAASIVGRRHAGAAWALRVVAGHLDHRAAWKRALQSFGASREQQAIALAGALRGSKPTVLGADLNSWSLVSLERAVPYLRGQFPSTPPEPRQPTFYIGLGIARRLDHMFFRLPPGWHATVERVNSRYGSDHYPLIAVLRLGEGQASGQR